MVMIIQNALQKQAEAHGLQLGAVNYRKADATWEFVVSRTITESPARCLAKVSYQNTVPLQVAVQLGIANVTFTPYGEDVFSRFEDAFQYMDHGFRCLGGTLFAESDVTQDGALSPSP